jgi:hypothetical protein
MTERYDFVVVGGAPGGICAAVAAARRGLSTVLLDRTSHVGGLPANGLGATDILTRPTTGGLFDEFVDLVLNHYVETYGVDSEQVETADDGYHFEPHVAECVFERLLDEAGVDVRTRRQFDALPERVDASNGRLQAVTVTHRDTGKQETYRAERFVDATYEGDLAAAAGASFDLGREGANEYDEPLAGKVYKKWAGPVGEHSTGEADNAIQAYNYRLCLTTDEENGRPIPKPDSYDRSEYVSLIEDIRKGRHTDARGDDYEPEGIQRVVNNVELPNDKVDANNQHAAFISTDLPEENWPWPSASWDWRDRFAERLREYTLGLLWFAGNDPELPESFRESVSQWYLAADEYEENDNFPRSVYVREGRRVRGDHWFTAHDALSVADERTPFEGESDRPPLYRTSVTASHYSLDSHAVRKREPDRVHLDGFINEPTEPYTVPFGVAIPRDIDGLLTPVPVSGTHVGFSTLRMEPCWMALGQAAGTAAALASGHGTRVRDISIEELQRALLSDGAVLAHYDDVDSEHPHWEALQLLGVRGFVTDWHARLEDPLSSETWKQWRSWIGVDVEVAPGETTRGEALSRVAERTAGSMEEITSPHCYAERPATERPR